MANTYTAVIPYESLDPLTIGASGDESKVSRGRSSSRSRRGTCSPPSSRTSRRRSELDRGRPCGPRVPGLRAPVLRARRLGDQGVRDHRQPVPPHPAVEAPASGARHDRSRWQAGRDRLRQREGLPHVGLGHRAEDRKDNLARMERLGISFHQNDPGTPTTTSTWVSRPAAHRSGSTRRSPPAT